MNKEWYTGRGMIAGGFVSLGYAIASGEYWIPIISVFLIFIGRWGKLITRKKNVDRKNEDNQEGDEDG